MLSPFAPAVLAISPHLEHPLNAGSIERYHQLLVLNVAGAGEMNIGAKHAPARHVWGFPIYGNDDEIS